MNWLIHPEGIYPHAIPITATMPLPLQWYLIACSLVVGISYFIASAGPLSSRPRQTFITIRVSWPAKRIIRSTRKVIPLFAVCSFLVGIIAGLIGSSDPLHNIAPTLFWTVAWVGVSILVAILADIWLVINPWITLYNWIQPLAPKISSTTKTILVRNWIKRLEAWPAFGLFMCFSWFELIYPAAIIPLHLSVVITVYTVITLIGIHICGREIWVRGAEFFSVAFHLVGKASPLKLSSRLSNPNISGDSKTVLVLANPISKLSAQPYPDLSSSCFVILMLSTMTIDGLMTTSEWMRLLSLLKPTGLHSVAIETCFWLLGIAMFQGAYWICMSLVAKCAKNRVLTQILGCSFSLSLMPIVVGYLIAHYLSLFVVQGQLIIPLLSDPFGFGWDVLGTRDYRIDLNLFGPQLYWTVAVSSVLLGHILSVLVAHVVSVGYFGQTSKLFSSLVCTPLILLMIGYTVLSLWILAQPIMG